MQVRVERVTEAEKAQRFVGIALIVLALGFLVVLAVVAILLSAIYLDAERSHPEVGATLCCVIFGVLLPVLGLVASVAFAVRSLRRASGLETILRAVRSDGSLDEALLTERLGPRRAERARIDALAAGALLPELAAMASVRPPAGAPAPTPTALAFIPPTGQGGSHRPPPRAQEASAAHAATSPAIAAAGLPVASWRPEPAGGARAGPLSPALATTTPMIAGLGSAPTHLLPSGGAPQGSPAAGTSARPGAPGPGADLVGRTLKGTWFVESRLAAGGMGAVHVARHVRTGRRYAVKTMLPDERLSIEAIHRFEREAKAASAVGHAGIVGVHDFDRTEDGVSFLVMDLLEGETLEDRLARAGRLSWADTKKIALEIAEALAAAHRAGVLHRDLKPSNVFLARREGSSERAVLVDFGLAKPIREGSGTWVTRTGAIVGTAHYMSPEQARGERVDVRTDVYGLSAVVYEMMAGVPPFLGSTAFAVMTMLLTEQPVAPSQLVPGVPAALDTLLLRGLAKSASERPDDVDAFAAALAAIA